jgi:hypothetical protein
MARKVHEAHPPGLEKSPKFGDKRLHVFDDFV